VKAFWQKHGWIVVPLVAGLAAYGPSLRGGFVWDDWVFFQRWLAGNNSLRAIFFPDPAILEDVPYYKPVAAGSSWLLYLLVGQSAFAWRAFTVALHLGTVAGAAFLFTRFVPQSPHRRLAACAGATLFAVWPLDAEAIGWISARADILIALGMSWALWLHLRARDRGGRPFLSALLFLMAMFSKETAVAYLPIAVVASFLLPEEEDATEKGWRAAVAPRLWLPYGLFFAIYWLMRRIALGRSNSIARVGVGLLHGNFFSAAFHSWGFYVRETLLLGHASPYLEYIPTGLTVVAFAVLGGLLLLAATLGARSPRGRPVFTAAAWFVLTLGPPLAVSANPSSITPIAIRYLYTPSLAVGALGAIVAAALLATPVNRRTLAGAFAVAVVALIVLDQSRIDPWLSDWKLWHRAVQDNPHSVLVYENLGALEIDAGRLDEAEVDDRIAAFSAIPVGDQQRVEALGVLARLYIKRGKYDDARVVLLEATKHEGTARATAVAMGTAAALQLFDARSGPRGQTLVPRAVLRQQIADLEQAAALDGYDTTSRLVLAIVYESLDEPVRAMRWYKELGKVSTDTYDQRGAAERVAFLQKKIDEEPIPERKAYYQGEIQESEGNLAAAAELFAKAHELAPDHVEYIAPLADAWARSGRLQEAIPLMTRAVELEPDSATLWLNLGVYHMQAHELEPGVAAFRRATEIAPGWPKAHVNLASALELEKDYAGAAAEYRRFLAVFTGTLDVRQAAENRIKYLEGLDRQQRGADENGP